MGAVLGGVLAGGSPLGILQTFKDVEKGLKDKPAAPPPAPEAPSKADPVVEESKDKVRASAASKRSKTSTLLSSNDGTSEAQGSGRKKRFLGN